MSKLVDTIKPLLRSAVVGSYLVLGGAATALVLAPAPAEAAQKQQTVSADVAKLLKPAQEALQKNDFDTALKNAREALAISKKPYDREMSLRIMGFAAAKKNDFATYAQTLEQLNELDTVGADEKQKSYKPLAQIYAQQKNYDKALQYVNRWIQTGGGAEAYDLQASIYLVQRDCKNAMPALERALQGRQANENQLKQQNFCYFQMGDRAKRVQVMEQMAQRFPKREYFMDLMQIYAENADERAMLNMYRLAFERDYLTREQEYVEYADIALNVGSPAEAQRVLERGFQKQVVKSTDRNNRLLAQAKQLAAEDRKLIAQLDKEARAGRNGEADVKVGLAYLGMGEYDKAVEAIQRGLQADRVQRVKRVDDANMMLGIALQRAKKQNEAQKAFRAAQEDQRMANAARLWLNAG